VNVYVAGRAIDRTDLSLESQMPGAMRITVRRARRGVAALVLATLLALGAAAGAGCSRNDVHAQERASSPVVTSPASEGPQTDGRRALRDGKALGKIDRLFSTPIGTKLN